MGTATVFGLSGFIIVLGFLANYLFKKTGIPDIIILLSLGLLIGPVFHLIDPSVFVSISQIFASLALMILLFEGGLNLNLYKFLGESPRASLLAVMGVITSMVITAIFTTIVLKWEILSGLLLGAMIGGSSSPIVIPLIRKLKVSEKLITLLSLESAFTDAIAVVVSITILQILTAGIQAGELFHGIASAFSIGAVLGIITGLAWLKALKTIKKEEYENILTLSIVLLLYSLAESLGGNGAISALVFGLVLGNGLEIGRIFRMKEPVTVTRTMKAFHSEISFLIRTFFFVYLGMIVMIDNLPLVVFSIVLSSLLFIGRFVAVTLTTLKNGLLKKSRDIMTIMLPRGLASAVLSQLPRSYGVAYAEMYPDIVFTVIMFTVIMCTIGLFAISKRYTVRSS